MTDAFPKCFRARRWGANFHCSTNCQAGQMCVHGFRAANVTEESPRTRFDFFMAGLVWGISLAMFIMVIVLVLA